MPNYPKANPQILTVGASLEFQVGFLAHGIVVDNYTNQWIFIRETFTYVGPYIGGRQIPTVGLQKITAMFQNPLGFSQPISIANQFATITATEAPVTASPGVPLNLALAPSKILLIEQSLAINGSAILLGGQPNQSIRMFRFHATLDGAVAAGWFKFRDGTAGLDIPPEFGTACGVTTGTVHHDYDFQGVPVAQNHALGILNSAAGAIFVRGGLNLDQG